MIQKVQRLALPAGIEKSLLAKLEVVGQAFARGQKMTGSNQLQAFIHELSAQGGKKISTADAERLSAQAQQIIGCV